MQLLIRKIKQLPADITFPEMNTLKFIGSILHVGTQSKYIVQIAFFCTQNHQFDPKFQPNL